MRNFFKRLRDSFRRRTPTRRIRDSSASQMAVNMAAADGSRDRYRNKSALGRAASDFAMDVGLTERDNQYYGNLANRQERSQQALADMRARRDRRRKRRNNNDDDTTDTTTETTETTTTDDNVTDTTTTTLDENTNTALTNVEDISDKTFNNTDDVTNYFDNTATSVNTAAGQEQNQASALTTSVGEAEDEAISYMTTGTGSNILTSAQGLLGGDDEDEDDPFNRRKTLIGA